MSSVNWKIDANEFIPSSQSESVQNFEVKNSDEQPIEGMLSTLSLASNLETDNWEKNSKENLKETMDVTKLTAKNTQVENSESPLNDILTGEGKEHLNIVFIGHVDAGKSTIGGHILYLTGQVDSRTMEKYEREAKEANRESWYLSWALDLNPEERAKGKTVEVGRGTFETERRKFTILDAPGHKSYVPNMISGASQADIAVLVISARKGEFETGFEKGGQTREHAVLAKSSGVKKLIVVINKMDDPTVQWSKERYDECVTKLKPYLKGCGYSDKDITFLPISGYNGANLKDRMSADVCSWFNGPSLLEHLDEIQGVERNFKGPFRMTINDKFRDMGTVIGGKIESGRVCKGQQLIVMPNRTRVEVLAILEDETEKEVGQCGEIIKLRLKGIEEEDVFSGYVICDPKSPIKATKIFIAQLMILEHRNIITAGYPAVMHIHNVVEEIQIAELIAQLDKKTGKEVKKKPIFARQGDALTVLIETRNFICMERFEDFPQLGRFTLRHETQTIAIGKVIDIPEDIQRK